LIRLSPFSFCKLLILMMWLWPCLDVQAQPFLKLSTENGLADDFVRTITQDDVGFIWVGSYGGVNRFDGHELKQIRVVEGPQVIDVRDIHQDARGVLWVGSAKSGLYQVTDQSLTPIELNGFRGLRIFAIDSFRQHLLLATDQGLLLVPSGQTAHARLLITEPITELASTNNGLWALTARQAVAIELQKDGSHAISNSVELPPEGLNTELLFADDRLYLGRHDGVFLLDQNCGCFVSLSPEVTKLNVKALAIINQQLWIGTVDQGMLITELNGQPVKHLQPHPDDSLSYPGKHVFALYADQAGNVWSGTFEQGVFYFRSSQLAFNPTRRHTTGFACSVSDVVYGFAEHNNILWLATDNGVVESNPENGDCRLLTQQTDALSGNHINAVLAGHSGLWVGSTQGLDHLHNGQTDPVGQRHQLGAVLALMAPEEPGTALLIGTRRGVVRYDMEEDSVQRLSATSGVLNQAEIYGFEPHHNNQVLVYSNQGLALLTADGQLHKQALITPDQQPVTLVTAVLSAAGGYWLAANDQYVLFIDNEGQVTDYSDAFAIGDGRLTVTGMLQDQQGQLWFAGTGGLWLKTEQTDTFWRFDRYDGVQEQAYKIGSQHLSADGQIYFGGNQGYNHFDPQHIKPIDHMPQVVVTQINQHNNSLQTGDVLLGGFRLEQPLNQLSRLELNHRDQSLSFELSVLDYASRAHALAYRLVNFNDDWVYLKPGNRTVNFTNLPTGIFSFQFRADNAQGQWGESVNRIDIRVHPAPWLSPWAFALYAVLLVAAVLGYIRYTTAASRRRALQLEAQVNERTQELKTQKQMVETLLDHKNELFANITHEFKTPLALIKGPAELLEQKPELSPFREQLQMIGRNTTRLLSMVSQILKLSEVEQQQPVIRVHQPIKPMLDMLFEAFKPLAAHKHIEINLDNQAAGSVYATPDSLEMIVGNLISNAIKYTPDGGQVNIRAGSTDGQVTIQVIDSGIGIRQQDQELVFSRFTRLDNQQNVPGTGIGLAVVKEITLANGGQVSLSSEPGAGSTFTVNLPLSEGEGSAQQVSEWVGALEANTRHEVSGVRPAVTEQPATTAGIQVLVIDDNDDMRRHIADVLSGHHQCILASRGREGVAMALKHMPDVVICDVMMPEMDGYQVTRILRNDSKTSHIPIILLTALDTKESRIKGWRENIDVYVTKPFDAQELLVKLQAIISVRRILQKKTQQSLQPEGDTTTLDLSAQDLKFVNKLKQVISDEYRDPMFMRPQMASKMAVSERQLQRKVKALIDETPIGLLRAYRLEMAARQLQDGLQVGIVADQCGFSSLSYFASCFRKKYGMTPKKYQQLDNKS
jgi:signal transduction histidine kinase/DNA-binding response OmpR family regulator/ligand-binding sensor domain-containing protein